MIATRRGAPTAEPRLRSRRAVGTGALAVVGGVVLLATAAAVVYAPVLAVVPAAAPLGLLAMRRLGSPFVAGLVVLLAAYSVYTVLPPRIALVAELGLLATSLGLAFLRWQGGDALPLLCWSPLAYWALLTLHPNIPSLDVGAAGLRKATLIFVFASLGLSVVRRPRQHQQRLVVAMLALGMASIAIHLVFPGIEQSIVRNADIYTSIFNGRPRLQGIFSGPFHAALLFAFLGLRGLLAASRGEARLLSAVAVLTGIVGIYYTQVRIGYVAMFLGFLLGWLLLPNNRAKLKRRTRAVAVGALVVASVAALPALATVSNDPALASLATLSDDQRAAARPLNWQRSIEALADSPVYGWGAGAAADTFDEYFPTDGRHVEPHNAFLKYFVEGGIVGGALSIALALALLRRMDWGDVDALAAVLVLALFGVTSTIVDALPVSALLFLVVGLSRKAPAPAVAAA